MITVQTDFARNTWFHFVENRITIRFRDGIAQTLTTQNLKAFCKDSNGLRVEVRTWVQDDLPLTHVPKQQAAPFAVLDLGTGAAYTHVKQAVTSAQAGFDTEYDFHDYRVDR